MSKKLMQEGLRALREAKVAGAAAGGGGGAGRFNPFKKHSRPYNIQRDRDLTNINPRAKADDPSLPKVFDRTRQPMLDPTIGAVKLGLSARNNPKVAAALVPAALAGPTAQIALQTRQNLKQKGLKQLRDYYQGNRPFGYSYDFRPSLILPDNTEINPDRFPGVGTRIQT
jgi:hypothetical protein